MKIAFQKYYLKSRLMFQQNQEAKMIDQILSKHRTDKQQLKHDKDKLFAMRVCCYAASASMFVFQLRDWQQGAYKDDFILKVYWLILIINIGLMTLSYYKDWPNLIRLVLVIFILRNIITLFDFGDKVNLNDMAVLIWFAQYLNMGILILICLMQTVEPWYFHVPASILFHIFVSFG